MRRWMLTAIAFVVGFALAATQPPLGQAMQKGDKDKKKKNVEKTPEKKEQVQLLVNEDFTNVKGTLPDGWVNRANKSAPSVVTRELGAIHPTGGKDRVFHSFDVPAAIEGDFLVEIKFSSFRQPPVADGKPQFPNLGVLLLDSSGKPASKDGALQAWQETGLSAEREGHVTIKANGDDKPVSGKSSAREGEGTPHTIRLDRKGKSYEITVDGDVLYTDTLGDLGDQKFSGIRIGMLGGDNIPLKKFGGPSKMDPVFTKVHAVKIGLKK